MQPKKEAESMTIAIVAHDSKKELMAQFCIAYEGVLSKCKHRGALQNSAKEKGALQNSAKEKHRG